MHAPRFLVAISAACLLVQACSDSEDAENADDGKAAESASSLPQAPLPSTPPVTPEVEPIDSCTLLNVRQVSEIIGHPMDGPEAGSTAGGGKDEGKMTSCSFASRSESQNAAPAELLAELNSSWFVTVSVWAWPTNGEGARNFMNAMRDAPMTDEPVQEVEGLADEAVWNGTLHARRENVTVSLDVRPPKGAENPKEIEKERALMEGALGRL